ncbi:MAG: (2Fe-2S)-binding protein [Bdellovibrionales bacterium]|nr:(2Fe-2S)-binding protein [Bdellovibrionales bacterium]
MFGKKGRLANNPTITFLPAQKTVEIKGLSTVLDLALSNKIELNHSCGGMGSCTTCRVIVEEAPHGQPARTREEQLRAQERGFEDRERLACQMRPTPGMVIAIPGRR